VGSVTSYCTNAALEPCKRSHSVVELGRGAGAWRTDRILEVVVCHEMAFVSFTVSVSSQSGSIPLKQ
jgi:hypothetical protein